MEKKRVAALGLKKVPKTKMKKKRLSIPEKKPKRAGWIGQRFSAKGESPKWRW